jgi:hypothetical protein
MKKYYMVLGLLLAGIQYGSLAQPWINSITVTTPCSTTNDTLRVYVDCMFPSGSCDPYLSNVYIYNNHINANALHCLGMLTVICNYTDTFTIPPLPAGNYVFSHAAE